MVSPSSCIVAHTVLLQAGIFSYRANMSPGLSLRVESLCSHMKDPPPREAKWEGRKDSGEGGGGGRGTDKSYPATATRF